MKLQRAVRHLFAGRLTLRHRFDAASLEAIGEVVRRCEAQHAGQIRMVIEQRLGLGALCRDQLPRDRAVEVFSQLRVWDTQHNNGVLIYLLLADRDVEIVADRGVAGGIVPADDWESCCRVMEQHFRAGSFREGAIAGIEAVASVLARHPPGTRAANEMPDTPVIL